jgi:uncharacterized membrane protein
MLKPERLAAFCDGVIAIAITILVLGIEVPSTHEVPEKELNAFLVESLPSIQGYVTSFLLIGIYWAQHYAIFHYIKRVDRIFLCLNGLFLLCVSFVPFPTGLQVAYRDDEPALILYAASHACCALSLLAIWYYATWNHRLIEDFVADTVIKSMGRRLSLILILCLLAMPVSLISLDLSRIFFLGIPISYISHRVVDRGWRKPPPDSDGSAD